MWSKGNDSTQTVSKSPTRKVLLWVWKGIIPSSCSPMTRLLIRTCTVNWWGNVLHQDNARLHTSLVTRQKLQEFGWEVSMYQTYRPDFARSVYHLVLSMAGNHSCWRFVLNRSLWIYIVPMFFLKIQESCSSYLQNGKKSLRKTVHIWNKSDNSSYGKYRLQFNTEIVSYILLSFVGLI